MIPEGPLFHPTTFNRTEFRNTLQVSSDNFLLVSLGNLAGYKGIAELIQASRNLEKKVSIRVAGWSGPKEEEELKMGSSLVKINYEPYKICYSGTFNWVYNDMQIISN